MAKYLVGIDRDGTINYDEGFFGQGDDWRENLRICYCVVEGLKLLKENGNFCLAVISNQSGVANGLFNLVRVREVNETINQRLRRKSAGIEKWYFCPFVDKEYAKRKELPPRSYWIRDNSSRKPNTGMLEKAAEDFGLDFAELFKEQRIFCIGNAVDDVKTALNANGKGILILNNADKKTEEEVESLASLYLGRVFIADNFYEAAKIILRETGG